MQTGCIEDRHRVDVIWRERQTCVMKNSSLSQSHDALASWDHEDKDAFRQWLRATCDFQLRASSDVCSRLKRLSSLYNIRLLKSDDDIDRLFSSRTVFGDDTRTDVRSQMKRAAKLYLQFRESKPRKPSR